MSNLFFFSLVLVAAILIDRSKQQCTCPTQTSCQTLQNAGSVVQVRINSQTQSSNIATFTGLVLRSYFGSFGPNQQITFSGDSQCVQLRNKKAYIVSLVTQAGGYWVDSCGIHSRKSDLSKDLWRTLNQYPGSCPVNGTLNCAAVLCVRPPCDNSYVPQGQCCPICPAGSGCTYGTNTYAEGATWHPLPCQTCNCISGMVACFQAGCQPLMCQKTYVPDGECCPVCYDDVGQCTVNGRVYSNGQTWNPIPCSSCTCQNGVSTCRDVQCPQLTCDNPYTPVGKCCPVCPTA